MRDYDRLTRAIQHHDYQIDAREAQSVARALRERGLKIKIRKLPGKPSQRLLQAS